MSAPVPSISPELRSLMRRLRLGRLLDTLPERVALARTHGLGHLEFLEQLLSDEVTRRDLNGASVRARAAHLDPTMVLEAWDETADVTYDRAIWSELVSLRFVEQAHNMGIEVLAKLDQALAAPAGAEHAASLELPEAAMA